MIHSVADDDHVVDTFAVKYKKEHDFPLILINEKNNPASYVFQGWPTSAMSRQMLCVNRGECTKQLPIEILKHVPAGDVLITIFLMYIQQIYPRDICHMISFRMW